jgi:hypothetical protein
MKRMILAAVMALSSAAALAQTNYSRVYSVYDKSAIDIYFLASDFARNKNLQVRKDPVNETVYMDVLVPFTGDECVQSQGLTGRLIIQAKDGKTRILMDSINYAAPETANKVSSLFIKTNFTGPEPASSPDCVPQSGALDNLNSCPNCRSSLDKVNSTLDSYFDKIAMEYKEFLKNEIKGRGY